MGRVLDVFDDVDVVACHEKDGDFECTVDGNEVFVDDFDLDSPVSVESDDGWTFATYNNGRCFVKGDRLVCLPVSARASIPSRGRIRGRWPPGVRFTRGRVPLGEFR